LDQQLDPTIAHFSSNLVASSGIWAGTPLTAPGIREVDFSIAKNTKFTEGTSLQLRVDVFNLANHTNFGFPNAALFTGQSPGLITSTTTTSRQLQLSAKFVF
jgi:hypothetical protein